jgi:cytochrome c-type biogenesis protein CcmE
LCGTVQEEGFSSNPAQLTTSFTIKGTKEHVAVVYHGVVPEMFQPNREVVVEGQLDAAGVFQADVLMTKCASKYDSADHPGARMEAERQAAEANKAGRAS